MKYVLGLTGPTGAGKTDACGVAEELGFYVINCDLVARKAADEAACLDALSEAFGRDILNSDNTLNRAALAKKAFSSRNNTDLLNKTIFPFILKLIEKEIKGSESEKILLDAPTLYEAGADKLCDDVCAVLSDKAVRKKRIMLRDSISDQAAELRMSAGKPDEYYKEKTQNIIYNDKDKEAFKTEFKNLLLKLMGGK